MENEVKIENEQLPDEHDTLTQPIDSNRARLLEILRSRTAEWQEPEGDEQLYGMSAEALEADSRRLAEYAEREARIAAMINADPRGEEMLRQWSQGKDPAVVLLELFGDDVVAAVNNPEKIEALANARREYLDRMAEEAKFNKEYEQNIELSLQTIETFQESHGMSGDQMDELMETLMETVRDAIMGRFTVATLDMLRRGLHYEADCEAARYEGEVKGRNERIREHLVDSQRGDGTVSLPSGGDGPVGSRLNTRGVLDLYGPGNTTIYERGGERRHRVR